MRHRARVRHQLFVLTVALALSGASAFGQGIGGVPELPPCRVGPLDSPVSHLSWRIRTGWQRGHEPMGQPRGRHDHSPDVAELSLEPELAQTAGKTLVHESLR